MTGEGLRDLPVTLGTCLVPDVSHVGPCILPFGLPPRGSSMPVISPFAIEYSASLPQSDADDSCNQQCACSESTARQPRPAGSRVAYSVVMAHVESALVAELLILYHQEIETKPVPGSFPHDNK